MPLPPQRGRGASVDPTQRFTGREIVLDGDELDLEQATGEGSPVRTRYLRDDSRSVISRNDSPDLGFSVSLNPYRGCEHGCSYCYARPTHEYLGLSAGLDFERIILVKEDAAELLSKELAKPSWQPTVMMLSGVTDPYQPIERKMGVTRSCLAVLAAHRQPVGLISKNAQVARDLDHLSELSHWGAVHVTLSITTLDEELRRKLEPRTSTSADRLRAIRELSEAGVRVGVNVAPIIPGLNDHEVPAILQAAADHGAVSAGWTLLRLPGAVSEVFSTWLAEHAPLRAERVLARIREARGGKLNESRFGYRMRGEGHYAEQIRRSFLLHRRRAGLERDLPRLSGEHFRVPGRGLQPGLF